jgi:hypothetical protein
MIGPWMPVMPVDARVGLREQASRIQLHIALRALIVCGLRSGKSAYV